MPSCILRPAELVERIQFFFWSYQKKNYLKKEGGDGRKALQYHSRQLALKATRQTVGVCAAN